MYICFFYEYFKNLKKSKKTDYVLVAFFGIFLHLIAKITFFKKLDFG